MDLELFRSYLIGILSSLSAQLLEKVFRVWLAVGLPLGYRFHIRQLRRKLTDMPFIYKDIETDLLNDVVEVEFETLEPATLAIRKQGRTLNTSTADRIKHCRHALFLGQAGVGKTTFFRQTILTMDQGKTRNSFFFPNERLIPFYVPLKAIDNAAPYPILRYLLYSNSILRGRRGRTRLTSLARQRRVFLLLDGYDEIPFPVTGKRDRNYIFDELRMILGTSDELSQQQADVDPIYEAFSGCRVWLSSRKEFYERFRIDSLDARAVTHTASDMIAVELRGIRNNRTTLAGRIFSKYRQRSPKYIDLLSEEYFIQDIDRVPEQDLITLSSNPLFLTVMCYIYASKVIESNTHEVSWVSNVSELVLECIRLLIRDLDENKARGLPVAQRAALLRRRNLYVEDKLRFLEYFAADSILQDKTIISVNYLNEKTLHFFKTISVSSAKTEIIQDLEREGSGVPNFFSQLIFSGVFVIVDRSGETIYYDFPHRLFRDVLASKYFDHHVRVRELLPNIDQQSRGEFVSFFFVNSNFQNEILQALLEKMLHNSRDDLLGLIVRNCLRNKPAHYDPSGPLNDFFLKAMRLDRTFHMPIEIFEYFHPSTTMLNTALQLLEGSVGDGRIRMNALHLSASLLQRFDKVSLAEFLTKNLDRIVQNSRTFGLIKYAILTDVVGLDRYLKKIFSSAEWMQELFPIVVKTSASLQHSLEFYRTWLKMLRPGEVVKVLAVLYDLDLSLFFRLTGMEDIDENWEVYGAVIRRLKDKKRKLVDKEEPSAEYFYVVTQACISKAKSTKEKDQLKPFRGQVYVEAEGLLSSREVQERSRDEPSDEASRHTMTETAKRYILHEGRYPTALWRSVKKALSTVQYLSPTYPEYFTPDASAGVNK